MRVLAGQADRGPVVSIAIVLASLSVLAITVLTGFSTLEVTLVTLMLTLLAVGYRSLLSWPSILMVMILLILFVPIRRYTMPGNLPFELEPYRLFMVLLVLGWTSSLLVDPRFRLRRTGFEAPLAFIGVVALASIFANPGRVQIVDADVVKKLMFFASFALVLYVVASVVRRHDVVDRLTKVLVAGGAVVAAFAIVEARTGWNLFNQLSGVIPLLRLTEVPGEDVLGRGARMRVYASAQHPIALSAALVMLTPFAFYLATRFRKKRWWICAIAIAIGSVATLSRTGIVMFAVVGLVFLWLRPRETRRLWPILLPALLVVHFALPGAIGSIKESFLPEGGLIAEQQKDPGWSGSGRIADLGPSLDEFGRAPIVGQGFGTRVVDPRPGGFANILDNQWLGTLLETGILGVIGWLWFFGRAVRRFGAEARRDRSSRGLFFTSIAASTAAFAIGMFTYDAFSFIQVTFLLFILVGLGAATVGAREPRRARETLRHAPAPAGGLEYA